MNFKTSKIFGSNFCSSSLFDFLASYFTCREFLNSWDIKEPKYLAWMANKGDAFEEYHVMPHYLWPRQVSTYSVPNTMFQSVLKQISWFQVSDNLVEDALPTRKKLIINWQICWHIWTNNFPSSWNIVLCSLYVKWSLLKIKEMHSSP